VAGDFAAPADAPDDRPGCSTRPRAAEDSWRDIARTDEFRNFAVGICGKAHCPGRSAPLQLV